RCAARAARTRYSRSAASAPPARGRNSGWCRGWCRRRRGPPRPTPCRAPALRAPRPRRHRRAREQARWCTTARRVRCLRPRCAGRRRALPAAVRGGRGGRPGAARYTRRRTCRGRRSPGCVLQRCRVHGAVRHAALDLGKGRDAVPEHLPLLLLVATVGLGVVEDVELVVVARAPEQLWSFLAHNVPPRAPQTLALSV